MAHSEDAEERKKAVEELRRDFVNSPDKQQATKDLLALTKDDDSDVRWRAADALGSAFGHVTDKQQASKDLLALTKDEYSGVRWGAVFALGSAFGYVTDKEQATKDLLALTKDEHRGVRWGAVSTLGSAFGHVTDKEQASKDLLALTKDIDSDVRSQAYHFLGKISILKATEPEEDFKKELEKALEYFEKSANEAKWFNPARFCLPFYRSFYTVTFRKEESEAEVKKSIKEAKEAVEGSESKEKLLDAIENLSNALTEAQKARSIGELKGDLTAYSRYCNRASELLSETEGDAPGATLLVKKGLPIINQHIKDILAEIKKKTDDFCKETRDTPNEDIGTEIHKIGKELSNVRDPIALEKAANNLQMVLSEVCNRMPGKNKGEACKILEAAKNEQFVEDKLNLLNIVLGKVSFIVPEPIEPSKPIEPQETPVLIKPAILNVKYVKNVKIGCFILILCSVVTGSVFYYNGFQDLNVPNYITILGGSFGILMTFYFLTKS